MVKRRRPFMRIGKMERIMGEKKLEGKYGLDQAKMVNLGKEDE